MRQCFFFSFLGLASIELIAHMWPWKIAEICLAALWRNSNSSYCIWRGFVFLFWVTVNLTVLICKKDKRGLLRRWRFDALMGSIETSWQYASAVVSACPMVVEEPRGSVLLGTQPHFVDPEKDVKCQWGPVHCWACTSVHIKAYKGWVGDLTWASLSSNTEGSIDCLVMWKPGKWTNRTEENSLTLSSCLGFFW